MVSVFSVDVEDWFHITNLPSGQGISEWDRLPSRVETNFRRLLELFSRHDVRVTCFFLGWVAERYPHLVREASQLGHEIASHGYSHSLVYTMSPEEFLADIRRSKDFLEETTGQPVLGYRAPGSSVTEKTPWFFEVVAEAGYRYDSSVFPTRHGHGGVAGTHCAPHVIPVGSSDSLIEFPISVAEVLTARLCLFGGGDLRLFPWWLIKRMAARVTRRGRPVTFYVHPGEIDPEPRLPMNPLRTFKNYLNLKGVERKVECILNDFPVTTFQHVLAKYGSEFAPTFEPPKIVLARRKAAAHRDRLQVDLCHDPIAWDRYVESQPDAYNYHRWRWREVIEETFGHTPYYLSASDDGELRGVLPLFSIQSRLFGNSLVSIPFFSYGGLLCDSAEAGDALMKKAIEVAGETGARHIELRQSRDLKCAWDHTNSKVTMGMALPSTADELWKRFSTGHRNKIRKSQKSGFRIQWGGAEAVEDFYPVFAANMRNLGTPVYPRKWFETICNRFPGEIQILTLWEGGRVAAAALLSVYRDTLELPWSASLPDTRKRYSHYLLYWTFLEWAIQNGFRWMDLGRCTPGSGTHDFKTHWVCEERPLDWYYWLAPGSAVPKVNTDNPRYHLAIEAWKHLPLAVANQLGPRIVRALP